MKIVLTMPFAGKSYCFPQVSESVSKLITKHKEISDIVIYDNSNDKDFSKILKNWGANLGINIIYHEDKSQHWTIENTEDYAKTSARIVNIYKTIFENLLPECDYVLNIEDDVSFDEDALEKLLGTLERNKSCVTAVGSCYGRRLKDRYFGVPVVFAFKFETMFPNSVGYSNKVSSHRIPEREEGEEIIGSAHVGFWLTKYSILKEMGWKGEADVGIAGDISWGYRLLRENKGNIMINWNVKTKHWFKNEKGEADYFDFYNHKEDISITTTMPLGAIIKTGSPTFRNRVQITK